MMLNSSVTQREDITHNQFIDFLFFLGLPSPPNCWSEKNIHHHRPQTVVGYKYRTAKFWGMLWNRPSKMMSKGSTRFQTKRMTRRTWSRETKKGSSGEEVWKGGHSIGHQGKERRQGREEERQWETCLPEGGHCIQQQGEHTFEFLKALGTLIGNCLGKYTSSAREALVGFDLAPARHCAWAGFLCSPIVFPWWARCCQCWGSFLATVWKRRT